MTIERRKSRESMRILWRAIKSPLVYDAPKKDKPMSEKTLREQAEADVATAFVEAVSMHHPAKAGPITDVQRLCHGKDKLTIEVDGAEHTLHFKQHIANREQEISAWLRTIVDKMVERGAATGRDV